MPQATLEQYDYIMKSLQSLDLDFDGRDVFRVLIYSHKELLYRAQYIALNINDPIVTERFYIFYRPNYFYDNGIIVYAYPTERYRPLFEVEG